MIQHEVQNPESIISENKNIPDMGRHLVLDFVGVPVQNLDVNSYDQIKKMFEDSLELAGLVPLKHTYKIFEPQGVTMLYVLDHGHLTIHTWPEDSACAIDFYHSSFEGPEKGWKQLEAVEEHICNTIGWEYCTSTIIVPRGNTTRVQNYDGPRKTEILQNVKFIHREKTQFYDLRIYDTQEFGRILWLNGYIQLNLQFLEEGYAGVMCGAIIEKQLKLKEENKDQSKIKILIIGGGDLLVAYYLISKYNSEKFEITIVDQDERVTQNVRNFFSFGAEVDEKIKNGSVQTFFEEGSNFIQKIANSENSLQLFDFVVLDISSDAMTDESPAQTLTTANFYQQLNKVLNKNGSFVMNIYSQDEVESYKSRWMESGFQTTEISIINKMGRNFIFGMAHKN